MSEDYSDQDFWFRFVILISLVITCAFPIVGWLLGIMTSALLSVGLWWVGIFIGLLYIRYMKSK